MIDLEVIKRGEMKRLNILRNSEINFEIKVFYDCGFDVQLGDEMNGYKAKKTCSSIEESEEFLWKMAQIFYPKAECFHREVK